MFITFEGIDGSGKSTQARRLAHALGEMKHPYILTREPGGTPLAEKIRDLIINDDMDETTQFFLFNAARRDHFINKIFPSLEAGVTVICDRFVDSTTVYQPKIFEELQSLAYEQATLDEGNYYHVPDITFILDIPAEYAAERLENRGNLNSFDVKPLEYHKNNREAFLKLAREGDQCRYCLVDANRDEDDVFKDIAKFYFSRTFINLNH